MLNEKLKLESLSQEKTEAHEDLKEEFRRLQEILLEKESEIEQQRGILAEYRDKSNFHLHLYEQERSKLDVIYIYIYIYMDIGEGT